MKEKEADNRIDLFALLENFLKTIKKFWIGIFVLTVLGAVLYMAYRTLHYRPAYRSQATFSVNTDGSSLVNQGSSGAEQVKESLPYILQSNVMKNLVTEEEELNWFPASLALEVKDTANFYVLTVTAEQAETANRILDSVVANIPRASVYVLGKIDVDVLDREYASAQPFNGMSRSRNLVTGAVLGLVFGLVLALFYSLTSRTIVREEDFKKHLSVSCLAVVPQITFKKRRHKIDRHILIYNDKVEYGFLEAMRTVRTRIEREADRLGAKVILVTGSISGEGKSTIAANLALSQAEKGKKTVLVDFDLRNPSIGKVLNRQNPGGVGITAILKKEKKVREGIQYIREWRLSVIYGGTPLSDPAGVLASDACRELLEELRKSFDYVILDTPPAAMLADASVIAASADCAVYVVKEDYARITQIAEGLDALAETGIPIAGAILNGLDVSFGGGYGSYRYARYGGYGGYGAYGSKEE